MGAKRRVLPDMRWVKVAVPDTVLNPLVLVRILVWIWPRLGDVFPFILVAGHRMNAAFGSAYGLRWNPLEQRGKVNLQYLEWGVP
jgi:hypothetical protein